MTVITHPVTPAVVYHADDFFHHQNPHCATCDAPMAVLVDGVIKVDFCARCYALDLQAIYALMSIFAWLASQPGATQEPIEGEPDFAEVTDPDPLQWPPLDVSYIRVWALTYEVASSGTVTAQGTTERRRVILVALLDDGTYHVERDEYLLCCDVHEVRNCTRYLRCNERNVFACTEHGEAVEAISPEDYAQENDED